MNKDEAIRILRGDVLGTNEQTHEAVFMAIKALKAEPKHGEWIFHSIESPYRWECNKCGDKVRARYNFCPNCGAKMERSEE